MSPHPKLFYKGDIYLMESNNYESFITQTVEAMLPTWHDRHMVLTMKIDADWHDFGYHPDGNTLIREASKFRKTFFLVFHRPMNYTKVLMMEIPQPPYDKKHGILQRMPCAGELHMKQLSDHDSCWRSDGMRWVFNTFVEAWNFFDNKKLPHLDGRSIDPMFHYSIFGGIPQYWLIKNLIRVDESDQWCSDYIIEFDRKVLPHEISEFMPKPKEK